MPTSVADEWQRCDAAGGNCTAIPGATSQSYTLSAPDAGNRVRVQETATNLAGVAPPAISAATDVVQAAPGVVKTAPGPTAAQIKARLLAQLAPAGTSARISRLRKTPRYTFSFTALTRGRLVIGWYFVPKGARVSKTKPKAVLIAGATASLSRPGLFNVTINLTDKGRRMLTHANRLTITARASYTPAGAGSIVASKTFTLKR